MDKSLIKVDDLLGVGKASGKLIDVIARGCGHIYKDWAGPIAEARKIKILSAAQTETKHNEIIEQTTSLLEADAIVQRTGRRLLVREIRRQNNIERVISLTAEEISGASVSEEPVSTDWATRFFDIAQDISDEKVQKIWSKILSGEIKKSGSFSLRTLEILKNITEQEAKLFAENVCPLVLYGEFVARLDSQVSLDKYNLHYGMVLKMRESGLINEGDSTVRTFPNIKDKLFILPCGVQKIELISARERFEILALVLTTAGKELYKIQDFKENKVYLEELKKHLLKNGFIEKESQPIATV